MLSWTSTVKLKGSPVVPPREVLSDPMKGASLSMTTMSLVSVMAMFDELSSA